MSERKKYPEIRYGQFTDAWEQRKLGEVADFFDEKRIPIDSGLRTSGEYPYYGATGVIDYVHDYIFDGEYVLLAEDGANIIMRNSPLAYLTQGKFWLNNHAHIMRMKDGDNSFLLQLLEKQNYVKYNTGTAQPKLNGEVVKKMFLTFPSCEEQAKIGTFFNQLDHLITLQQRKYEKTANIKRALLEKMFPKNREEKPEIRFEKFTDAWEQRKLEEVVDVRSGRDYKHLSEGNIPVYGTGGYMLSVSEALSYAEDGIGIGRKGTIDKPYLLRAPFWTVDTLFYAVPKEKYDLDFLHSVFQRVNWKQKDESTGVPSLSKTTINEVHVAVPEYEEQVKIGSFFSRLDHLMTLHQRELEKLKNIKKALIQKMLV